jgi:hypothetical protein
MRRSVSIWFTAAVPLVLAARVDTPAAPTRLGQLRCASADIAASSIWADRRGTIGNGALYALFKPVNWNGDVVYFAHGIIDPRSP